MFSPVLGWGGEQKLLGGGGKGAIHRWTRGPLGSPKPLSKAPLHPLLANYSFSEGLIHLLLLLVLFLTLVEDEAGAETEGHRKPGSFTGGETESILRRRQNLLNNYSKGQTELNMQKFNFMFIHDPVACISGLDLQRKFLQ